MLRPQDKLNTFEFDIHHIFAIIFFHPVKKTVGFRYNAVYISLFRQFKQHFLIADGIIFLILDTHRRVIHMGDPVGRLHQCIERFIIRFGHFIHPLHGPNAHPEGDLCPRFQFPGQFSGFFNDTNSFIIFHPGCAAGDTYGNLICHARTGNTGQIGIRNLPDFPVGILYPNTCPHRIGHMVALLCLTADQHCHIGIVFPDTQKILKIFDIFFKWFMK